jgi:hypothetical protein
LWPISTCQESQLAICVPFLVLDLGLDIVNGVGGLHLEGDGLAGEAVDYESACCLRVERDIDARLYEDLHSLRQGRSAYSGREESGLAYVSGESAGCNREREMSAAL